MSPVKPKCMRCATLAGRRVRLASFALALLVGAGGVRAVGAQAQALGPGGSAPLTFDHWSYELIEALDVAGLASGWMTGVRPTGREVVRGELHRVRDNRFGAARAGERFGAAHGGVSFGSEHAGETIAAWTDRFDRDFPARPPAPDGEAAARRGQLVVGAGVRSGDAFLDPGGGFFGTAAGALSPSPRTALWGRVDVGGYDRFGGVQSLGASFPLGAFTVMAGRQRLKAAGPAWTSAQLDGGVPLDALYLVSDRPIALPGTKWLIGPAAWHFSVAPIHGIGETDRGWIGMGGFIAQPHSRLRLGATRSAQFGPGLLAQGSDAGVTPLRVLRMFAATQNDPTWWDDQKLELSARFRWGMFGQPLGSYLILAQEDSPLWKDPGILIGTSAPFVRASGLFNLRYEYTAYGQRARWCPGCEYARGEHGERFQAPWYDHGNFERYQRGGVPLGDPLGGYGSNHKASLSFWSNDGRTRARAWTFFERREEGNLLFNRWPGKRRGGGLEVARELADGFEAMLNGVVAAGPRIDRSWGFQIGLYRLLGAAR